MSIRATLVAVIPAPIEAMIKFAIYGDPDSPRAVSRKIGRRLPRERIKTAFDVGANVGQSIRALSAAFPGVQIFSFEPDPDTFLQLEAGSFDAKLFNYGFGAEDGLLRFDNSGQNQMRHIAQDQGSVDLPTVRIRRLDNAFSEFGVDEIDYLKIDTEGHDLEVLRGAAGLLRDSKIKIVETECGVNRDNKHHVPFAEIQNYLEDFGYRLFHIYEQCPEWPTDRPNLRRVNAVFISPVVIERNARRNA
jgi:FkbM family methyltransferase